MLCVQDSRRSAFSLVELLTVIFIIGLLIAILVPSLSAARNAAKKMTTAKSLDSVKVGLEMFKGENGPEFPQSNGYPPSFAHPPISGYAFQPELGEFPFLQDKPAITGAHWLPAMLMGVDQLGYIKRSTVLNKDNLREQPYRWYSHDPNDPLAKEISELPRGGPYVDVALPTKRTKDLPGRPSQTMPPPLFRDWDRIQELPVVVDAFDQTILYYVANAHGRTSNMVADDHPPDNIYPGDPQQDGPPFYFHQDNAPFTGVGTHDDQRGWDFSNSGAKHTIALSGANLTADMLIAGENRDTFAHYIVDRKIYRSLENPALPPSDKTPLRPVNAEGYLLISAGVDGKYGTNDDVSNLPPFTE